MALELISKDLRRIIPVMIICKNRQTQVLLRHALVSIGFTDVSTTNYIGGLAEAREKEIYMILFDAEAPAESEMSAVEFVQGVRELRKDVVLIAVAPQPTSEVFFALLKAGTAGFLLPPFTPDALEDVFGKVQRGIPFGSEIFETEDRNQKFAELILEQLDRMALFLRENPGQRTPEMMKQHMNDFLEIVRMARLFCQSGEDALMTKLHEHLLHYAELTAEAPETGKD